MDDAAFGVEISDDCAANLAVPSGTTRVASQDATKGFIRTGAVPVRTLNIPDEYMADGYNHRFVYAVTEAYTADDAPLGVDSGAITIQDAAGNSATAKPDNIVQIVYSTGWDTNGEYTVNGAQISACDTAKASGVNCDTTNNALFVNSLNKSGRPDDPFVNRISYRPSKTVLACEDKGLTVPKDTAFLIDTSGSMASRPNGACPTGLSRNCNRMDVAHWAMRRVMPARLYSNTVTKNPGDTLMTGFVGSNSTGNVESGIRRDWNKILFDDAPDDGTAYVPRTDAEIAAAVDKNLAGMCPSGGTPLGIHMEALANTMGDGDADRPNKITIISDGESNNGTSPVTVALAMKAKYPNIQVDIIDVVGNPTLRQVADITGGAYYRSNNPDELLDALYSSAGICNPYTPAATVDKPACR